MRFFKNFISGEYAVVYRSVSENGGLLFQNEKTVFKTIPNSKRYWYADPMLFEFEGRHLLFAEAFDKKANLGRIACCELKEDGSFSEMHIIISEDFHLSYPNVFKLGEKIVMIPEAAASNKIWLFECVEFPLKWRKTRTLLDGKQMVDSTLLENGSKLWLFSAEIEKNVLHGTNLNLYEVTERFELIPHGHNPVVTDIASSRPAGTVFTFNGELIRPAQDCSQGNYGRALKFNKITALGNDTYHEELIGTVSPKNIMTDFGKKITGCHTYGLSEDGRLEVADVKYNTVDIALGIKINIYNVLKKLRLIK